MTGKFLEPNNTSNTFYWYKQNRSKDEKSELEKIKQQKIVPAWSKYCDQDKLYNQIYRASFEDQASTQIVLIDRILEKLDDIHNRIFPDDYNFNGFVYNSPSHKNVICWQNGKKPSLAIEPKRKSEFIPKQDEDTLIEKKSSDWFELRKDIPKPTKSILKPDNPAKQTQKRPSLLPVIDSFIESLNPQNKQPIPIIHENKIPFESKVTPKIIENKIATTKNLEPIPEADSTSIKSAESIRSKEPNTPKAPIIIPPEPLKILNTNLNNKQRTPSPILSDSPSLDENFFKPIKQDRPESEKKSFPFSDNLTISKELFMKIAKNEKPVMSISEKTESELEFPQSETPKDLSNYSYLLKQYSNQSLSKLDNESARIDSMIKELSLDSNDSDNLDKMGYLPLNEDLTRDSSGQSIVSNPTIKFIEENGYLPISSTRDSFNDSNETQTRSFLTEDQSSSGAQEEETSLNEFQISENNSDEEQEEDKIKLKEYDYNQAPEEILKQDAKFDYAKFLKNWKKPKSSMEPSPIVYDKLPPRIKSYQPIEKQEEILNDPTPEERRKFILNIFYENFSQDTNLPEGSSTKIPIVFDCQPLETSSRLKNVLIKLYFDLEQFVLLQKSPNSLDLDAKLAGLNKTLIIDAEESQDNLNNSYISSASYVKTESEIILNQGPLEESSLIFSGDSTQSTIVTRDELMRQMRNLVDTSQTETSVGDRKQSLNHVYNMLLHAFNEEERNQLRGDEIRSIVWGPDEYDSIGEINHSDHTSLVNDESSFDNPSRNVPIDKIYVQEEEKLYGNLRDQVNKSVKKSETDSYEQMNISSGIDDLVKSKIEVDLETPKAPARKSHIETESFEKMNISSEADEIENNLIDKLKMAKENLKTIIKVKSKSISSSSSSEKNFEEKMEMFEKEVKKSESKSVSSSTKRERTQAINRQITETETESSDTNQRVAPPIRKKKKSLSDKKILGETAPAGGGLVKSLIKKLESSEHESSSSSNNSNKIVEIGGLLTSKKVNIGTSRENIDQEERPFSDQAGSLLRKLKTPKIEEENKVSNLLKNQPGSVSQRSFTELADSILRKKKAGSKSNESEITDNRPSSLGSTGSANNKVNQSGDEKPIQLSQSSEYVNRLSKSSEDRKNFNRISEDLPELEEYSQSSANIHDDRNSKSSSLFNPSNETIKGISSRSTIQGAEESLPVEISKELEIDEIDVASIELPPKLNSYEPVLRFKPKPLVKQESESSGDYKIPTNISIRRKSSSKSKENEPPVEKSRNKISDNENSKETRQVSRKNSFILDRILLNDQNRPRSSNIYHTEPFEPASNLNINQTLKNSQQALEDVNNFLEILKKKKSQIISDDSERGSANSTAASNMEPSKETIELHQKLKGRRSTGSLKKIDDKIFEIQTSKEPSSSLGKFSGRQRRPNEESFKEPKPGLYESTKSSKTDPSGKTNILSKLFSRDKDKSDNSKSMGSLKKLFKK